MILKNKKAKQMYEHTYILVFNGIELFFIAL